MSASYQLTQQMLAARPAGQAMGQRAPAATGSLVTDRDRDLDDLPVKPGLAGNNVVSFAAAKQVRLEARQQPQASATVQSHSSDLARQQPQQTTADSDDSNSSRAWQIDARPNAYRSRLTPNQLAWLKPRPPQPAPGAQPTPTAPRPGR